MAIFKAPRLTQSQRESLALDASEIVFDLTLNKFFGGDGSSLGGFPIGQGTGSNVDQITITQTHIDNKAFELSHAPLYPESVILTPMGGIPQLNGIDFEVNLNVVNWSGLGLDGFIELGDTIVIHY